MVGFRNFFRGLIGKDYPNWLYKIFDKLYEKTDLEKLLPIHSKELEPEFREIFLKGYQNKKYRGTPESVIRRIKSFNTIPNLLKQTRGNQKLLKEKLLAHLELFEELGGVLHTFEMESLKGLSTERKSYWKALFKKAGIDEVMQKSFPSLRTRDLRKLR
tara:strand:- start:4232 stop:4708 length:477 start_codon:yes stop_codon:yes gene_type:complete